MRLPRPPHPSSARIVCAIVLLLPFLAHGQAWSTSATAGFSHHNNVTNSAQEEKSDHAFAVDLNYGTHRMLSRNVQGTLSVSANSAHWFDYEGLDLAELNLNGNLRWKFGLGPYAPRLDTGLTVGRLVARVDEWSGNHLRANATVSKRLSPAWLLSAGLELNRLDANRAVYSHTQWNTTVAAHYDPTTDWRISLKLRHRSGDQLSWCRNSWAAFAGTTQWLDGIFGGDWFPYRTEADLQGGAITVARALGRSSTMALGVEATRSTSSFHKTYQNRILSLQLVHAF